jgi:hypothetical protein
LQTVPYSSYQYYTTKRYSSFFSYAYTRCDEIKKREGEREGERYESIPGEIRGLRLLALAFEMRRTNLAIGGCSLEARDGSGNKRMHRYRFFSIDKYLAKRKTNQLKP